MSEALITAVDRRRFVTRLMPACSLACLSSGSLAAIAAASQGEPADQGLHKFDIPAEVNMTPRQLETMQSRLLIGFIKTLRAEIDERELIRLLEIHSAEFGRSVGARQAENSPDTSFKTFTNTFRPPNYEEMLTLDMVEDTDKVFQLEVRECLLAEVFRDAGVDGEIGHAAVCNMDYYWPPAFNENFKMERSKTLMQGHDHCNHRYLDTS